MHNKIKYEIHYVVLRSLLPRSRIFYMQAHTCSHHDYFHVTRHKLQIDTMSYRTPSASRPSCNIALKRHAMGNCAMCHLLHSCVSGTFLSDLGRISETVTIYMVMLLRQLIEAQPQNRTELVLPPVLKALSTRERNTIDQSPPPPLHASPEEQQHVVDVS